jgi:glucosyl-3-phosphoglycerate synthase
MHPEFFVSDFHQSGVITTFHRIGKAASQNVEKELEAYAKDRPVSLILPSLFSELRGTALAGIISELKKITYVREIIVTLGPASEDEFKRAKSFFSVLPQETRVIWNDSPALTDLCRSIAAHDLETGEPGKGRSVWTAFGYIFSGPPVHAVVLHDSDIESYDRSMLARLCYPVANPNLDYDFCKGFYARVTDRMHGRVTRLLMVPLLRSLQKTLGPLPLIAFLDSFRYVLAGEFSMDTKLARVSRVNADWGLEVGVLAEVYRNASLRRVCQVDIADEYEHKHQDLSPHDPSSGLHRMAVDVCASLFRTFASEGIVLPEGFFPTLVATYAETAWEMLERYEDEAAMNGLGFDRLSETCAVETFTRAIEESSGIVAADPLGSRLMSSWDRVTSAVPGVLARVRAIVEEENR